MEKLGTIPTESDEGKVIETDEVVYKIEKVENKHISKVKACKIEQTQKNEE